SGKAAPESCRQRRQMIKPGVKLCGTLGQYSKLMPTPTVSNTPDVRPVQGKKVQWRLPREPLPPVAHP
ncbi:MAG: hypothetical protein WAU71_16080, partial [Pyrinomonadaceae bacterium]